MEIISLGGGVQSSALLILNTLGHIEPRASHAVFADTGGEFESTLGNVARLADWSACNGGPKVIVVHRKGPGLFDWHFSEALETGRKVTPVCVRAEPSGGLWKRDCTIRWKIKPIERWLKSRTNSAVVQLGISYDEAHRVKENPTRWITNRWPLVDLKMTRRDCQNIFSKVDLPIPSKSACYFCPLRPMSYWPWLAASDPDKFDKACQLENQINRFNTERGKEPTYLSQTHGPLRASFSTDQLLLWDDQAQDECGGFCFT